ncbi:hypothetical protein [Chryseobacterium elymi]|nr:hypothetical protein [Chryseobacterium elymi]
MTEKDLSVREKLPLRESFPTAIIWKWNRFRGKMLRNFGKSLGR